MASNVINGKDMSVKVDGVALADVTEFQVNREAKIGEFATSSTGGYMETLKGNRRWTCQFNVGLPAGNHDIGSDEGDLITFTGISTTGQELEGSARVNTVNYTVAVDDENPILATVSCIGHGTYTK